MPSAPQNPTVFIQKRMVVLNICLPKSYFLHPCQGLRTHHSAYTLFKGDPFFFFSVKNGWKEKLSRILSSLNDHLHSFMHVMGRDREKGKSLELNPRQSIIDWMLLPLLLRTAGRRWKSSPHCVRERSKLDTLLGPEYKCLVRWNSILLTRVFEMLCNSVSSRLLPIDLC